MSGLISVERSPNLDQKLLKQWSNNASASQRTAATNKMTLWPQRSPPVSRLLLRAGVVISGVAFFFLCLTSLRVSQSQDTQLKKIHTVLHRPVSQACVGGKCFSQTSMDEQYAQYFIPRKEKVNPFPLKYVVPGSSICLKGAPVYLVILVPSIQTHVEERRAIRNSWGSVARGNHWPRHHVNTTVKLVFLFGKDPAMKNNRVAQLESEMYGDVVQGDYVDTYANLTRKMLMGLNWVSSYCTDAEYVLKADEDTFVHIPKLVSVLARTRHPAYRGVVLGHVNVGGIVKRVGRWKVEQEDYPFPHYPPYVSGNTYVISSNIAASLFRASEYFPYIPIEDAYITGILAKAVTAEVIDVPGFTFYLDRPPHACNYLQDSRISSTKVSSHLKIYIWEKLLSNSLNCKRKLYTENEETQ
ncbi:beta-1,3-galactosyltransferase 5-like [Mizuhopecten yessoensis]|uniref:beta-1,3-galactosyltransferase 5-like n=1 Tax=Mizuhopecten yessoensis TaxID=6573 RepID=UPI000B459F97|nr:beta-1,3-galactosyltransferase 5-like [Mizuhopecten yessoensis]